MTIMMAGAVMIIAMPVIVVGIAVPVIVVGIATVPITRRAEPEGKGWRGNYDRGTIIGR